jgi:lipoprotein-anchoring transpeptidase ErfK/SrfK
VKKTLFAILVAAVGAAGLATVDAAHARGDVVTMKEAVTPGTIIVRTQERRLYYVTGAGQAISYPVGVGRVGKQWSGTSYISGKYTHPAWSPPAEVRRDKPHLPQVIPGGSSMKGRISSSRLSIDSMVPAVVTSPCLKARSLRQMSGAISARAGSCCSQLRST